MPFNGSGIFQPIPAPDYPAVAGTTIKARQYNNFYEDVAEGLSNCLTRDGQSPAQANIPMGGFKLTGLAAGVDPEDAVRFDQLATATLVEGDWTDVVAGTEGKVLGTKLAGAGRLRPMGGLWPSESSPAAMSIHIDAGYYVSALGVLTLKGAGTQVIAAADGTNDRIDVVYLDLSTGSFGVVAGTPAGTPSVPALPTGLVAPIALVGVGTAVTTIVQADITDVRGPMAQAQAPAAGSLTGLIGWWYRRTAPTGWVELAGGTIGSAASGATARANADVLNLFTMLWNDYDAAGNMVIQTSAGAGSTPGASAAADWAANKRLVIADMRGQFPRGWDNGAGVDIDRVWASEQDDNLKSHRHRSGILNGQDTPAIYASTVTGAPGAATEQMEEGALIGTDQQAVTSRDIVDVLDPDSADNAGTETRVKNYAFLWAVKL